MIKSIYIVYLCDSFLSIYVTVFFLIFFIHPLFKAVSLTHISLSSSLDYQNSVGIMARVETTLEDLYSNIVIDGEEENEIVVSSHDVVEQKPIYMLVGKFLTEKHVNFQAMQNLMASLWRPREGM